MESVLRAVHQRRHREDHDGSHLGVEHPAPPALRHAVREDHDEQREQWQAEEPQHVAEPGVVMAEWALAQHSQENSLQPQTRHLAADVDGEDHGHWVSGQVPEEHDGDRHCEHIQGDDRVPGRRALLSDRTGGVEGEVQGQRA